MYKLFTSVFLFKLVLSFSFSAQAQEMKSSEYQSIPVNLHDQAKSCLEYSRTGKFKNARYSSWFDKNTSKTYPIPQQYKEIFQRIYDSLFSEKGYFILNPTDHFFAGISKSGVLNIGSTFDTFINLTPDADRAAYTAFVLAHEISHRLYDVCIEGKVITPLSINLGLSHGWVDVLALEILKKNRYHLPDPGTIHGLIVKALTIDYPKSEFDPSNVRLKTDYSGRKIMMDYYLEQDTNRLD